MSQYCDNTELRAALPLDGQSKTADFADLISEVSDGFDQVMGFSYGGPARIVHLDGNGLSKLMLPRPGARAAGVVSVVEAGTTLDASQYELEPAAGRYLLRLDSAGAPSTWREGARAIVVTYAPMEHPESLRQACIREVVKIYRSRQMGHAKVIGSPRVSELAYADAYDPATMGLLRRLSWNAGNGGVAWVTM